MLFIIHFLYYLFRIAIRIKFRLFFFSPSKKQQKYKKRKNCKKTRSRSFHKSFKSKIFRGRTRQKHRMPHWSIFTSLSYTLNPPLFQLLLSDYRAFHNFMISILGKWRNRIDRRFTPNAMTIHGNSVLTLRGIAMHFYPAPSLPMLDR